MSTSADSTLPLKTRQQSTWPLSTLQRVICSTWSGRKRIWAKIQRSTFSSRCAPEYIIYTSRAWFIETSSLKISSSKRAILSRFVILDGVSNQTTCSREILFAVLSSTWLLKWSKTKITTTRWIYGPLVSYSTSWSTAEPHLLAFIPEKSAIRSWEAKSDSSQVSQTSTKISSTKY